MTSRYQTCECKSTSPPVKDFPHLALLVNNNEEETISELPMCPKQVDEICKESPKRVALYYTTINTEAISADSSPETIWVVGRQEEWEGQVEIWFWDHDYEPVEHHALDSELFPNYYQGLDRFAAYAYHLDESWHAWLMKMELERSSATLHR
ncbi:hypothetical protein IWW34DRAFT_233664 [Fusarium oxysporum f. sp. albedinis]|nr:hypothetical protein IWW34DRAFT_233664 [Fusarium oxysporum f. sp. albedinis]KAJ0139012.1 Uncharacterized protein HZ326_18062 [Fusarium oxysporum f. sp. albedinis]